MWLRKRFSSTPSVTTSRVRLIHGDNAAVAEELAREGVQLDLLYVDPPFGVGAACR